jgi:hypothetical protein
MGSFTCFPIFMFWSRVWSQPVCLKPCYVNFSDSYTLCGVAIWGEAKSYLYDSIKLDGLINNYESLLPNRKALFDHAARIWHPWVQPFRRSCLIRAGMVEITP